jgi:hypothetical protein
LQFPALTSAVLIGPLVGWFVALAIKHVVADFLLQNAWMANGKDSPNGWALPLLAHCLIHGLLTTAILIIVAPRLWFVGVVDFLLHLAIDRAKGWTMVRLRVTADHPAFWWLIGIDQALHHLTGLGLAILLAANLPS